MEAQSGRPPPQQNQKRTLLLLGGGVLVLLVFACCALGVIGTALGALGSFGFGGPNRVRDTLERSVEAAAPLVLTIDNPVGDVTLLPDADGEVRVEATRFAPSTARLAEIDVRLSGSGNRVELVVEGPERGSNWGANLVVHVPPQTSAVIEGGVGEIRLEGLEGTFSVRSGVGDIVAADLTIGGEARFEAGTGEVQVGAVLREGVTLRAESGVGEITIALPAGTGFELDASTGTGSIELQGVDLEGQQREDRSVGDEIHNRTETDPEGRHLILSTGVGDILIRAR